MIKKLLSSLALLVLTTAMPATALAATNPYQSVNCAGQAAGSAICQGKGNTEDPISGPNGALKNVVNIVAFIAGLAAVVFIVIAGIRYITSQGDPQEVSKAKQSIIYAAVGLVIIVAAHQIISFVIGKI
jgi:hypothetical protein